MDKKIKQILDKGLVIPASPLALTAEKKMNERRQRALWRYYIAAGVGGMAIGVHTTQFAIRDPKIGLFKPVLELAKEEFDRGDAQRDEPLFRVAGICGKTEQAVSEAHLVRELGFHAGLLSLAVMKDANDDELIAHCKAVSEIIPVFGFYLQPAVGGRVLPYSFWRRFAEIENIAAIKIAPFDRYQSIDVARAVAESGRDDITLYTGNDDNIVMDLVTPFRFNVDGKQVERRIVGGLLGHWAIWTQKAVELLKECHAACEGETMPTEIIRRSVEVTDANSAFFDAATNFVGCVPGLHEVLRRQGIFEGTWCLNPNDVLSPGQMEEIDRVYKAYPHLNDDAFVSEHLDEWLSG